MTKPNQISDEDMAKVIDGSAYEEAKKHLGTENFKYIANKIGEFVDIKNADYGSAFITVPAMMKQFYPNGVEVDQYIEFILISRILEKCSRIANGAGKDFTDIVGHSLLGVSIFGSKLDHDVK